MMPMHFYFSDKVTLLFEFWDVSNVSGMALSLLVVLLMAVLYEVIKVGKAVFHHDMRSLKMSASWEAVGESETSSLDSETSHHAPINSAPSSHLPVIPESSLQTPARKRWFLYHVCQSAFHLLQVVLGYMLMLCVMSYNTWIFLGVLVGAGVGYYISYSILALHRI